MPVTIHQAEGAQLAPAHVEMWRAIPVAVAVDLGRDIGQIDPAIRPLRPPGQQPRLAGRAVTALCEPGDIGAMLHAVDRIETGDVLVLAAAGYRETAMIGEVLGGQVRRRGGAGIVCDGAVRDVAALASWPDFSVFARWITPRGPTSFDKGAVDVPVIVGGCRVLPGDLVLGDDDGLVVLTPAAAQARIEDARAKLALEARWEEGLAGGRSVRETFGLDGPEPSP